MGQVRFAKKLSIGIVVLTTIAVALATTGLATGIFVHTEQHVKDDLINNVNNVISENLTVVDKKILQKEFSNNQTLGVTLRAKDLSAIIIDDKGEILARYGIYKDLEDENLIVEKSASPKYMDIVIPGYGLFDTYTVPIRAGNEVFGYMRMIKKNSEIEILKQTIEIVILIIFPVAWTISLIFAYFMVKRVTTPLTKLVEHLENIDHESMQVIADSHLMDHEVSVVTKAINNLIIKLREHHKRERQITENISHEFKTPLTRIASNLQVGKVKEAEIEVLELGGNVDALLSLAIWEKTNEKSDVSPVLKHLFKLIPSTLKVSMSVPKKMMISLPSSHIQVILRNLIDNAIKHNKDKGEIIIKANMQKDKWQIQLSNTTKNNLDEARIVERKYKTGETAGHGIGMSIVSDLCKMHDLTLEFSEQGKMVTVMISGKKIS